ncbi:PREDICTED: C-type mannose receptor 2-like [Cyprinodon variegatus]|uniref:C-type mannose receptor 2-like n=1 Tax=Cyprinodon variegatus TaxID=28743 RepID=UPI000742ABBA|nr:PREDICTED: C-type mannose receptor 2-like [Cyprinodon variegatus]
MFCQLYEYHYIEEEKPWIEAQQYCREKHTDLATVFNFTEMERLLSISAGDMKEAWIGLYDQTDGIRTWYWSLPGVEFNETNWYEGEPDDRETENCYFIQRDNNLQWEDISCDFEIFFICYNESNTSQKFYLIEQNKTWLEAQSYCRKKHTDLISGLDQLQDEQFLNLFNLTENQHVFIGLFRDTWRWSDGSSFSFRHWNLQYDDDNYNSGQCAVTVFDDEGRWKNEDCREKKPFICYDAAMTSAKNTTNLHSDIGLGQHNDTGINQPMIRRYIFSPNKDPQSENNYTTAPTTTYEKYEFKFEDSTEDIGISMAIGSAVFVFIVIIICFAAARKGGNSRDRGSDRNVEIRMEQGAGPNENLDEFASCFGKCFGEFFCTVLKAAADE